MDRELSNNARQLADGATAKANDSASIADKRLETRLDEALQQSFPASDPIALAVDRGGSVSAKPNEFASKLLSRAERVIPGGASAAGRLRPWGNSRWGGAYPPPEAVASASPFAARYFSTSKFLLAGSTAMMIVRRPGSRSGDHKGAT